jgi:hypothetical protein
MAKPTPVGASPRAPDADPPKRTPWRKYEFDDEALEELRRRYEETDEPALWIARSRGISDTHFNRMAKDRGWVRFKPGRIGLSPAAKLNNRADALLRARVEEGAPPMTRGELRTAAETVLRSAQAHAADLETLRQQTAAWACVRATPTSSPPTSPTWPRRWASSRSCARRNRRGHPQMMTSHR